MTDTDREDIIVAVREHIKRKRKRRYFRTLAKRTAPAAIPPTGVQTEGATDADNQHQDC